MIYKYLYVYTILIHICIDSLIVDDVIPLECHGNVTQVMEKATEVMEQDTSGKQVTL